MIGQEDFWLYISMPFICAAVGYGTNWLCIKMMSYPTEFIGIMPPFLGWQGVIPRRAPVIAAIQVDIMTSRLITVEEIFSQISPEEIANQLKPILPSIIEDITDDLMMEQMPRVWEAMPLKLKQRVYKRAREHAPQIIEEMMSEVQANIDEVFDLKGMITNAFTDNPEMLVKLIQEVGYKELTFVQNSGAIFGFLFGIIQMFAWMVYQEAWILPAAGILVGSATNWLALNMIFSPKYPTKVGPFTLHGLFMKRQQEVAVDFGLIISREILNPHAVMTNLLQGPASDKMLYLVQKNVKRNLDEFIGYTKPLVTLSLGSKRFQEIKNHTVARIMAHLPEAMALTYQYTEDAMDIDNVLRTKMGELTPEEFEGILRPAFKEDEKLLIALGAGLGFLVGWGQLFFMFGVPLTLPF
jgi:uncharacterized membrane protein YheB (UPF0754 family)